MSDMNAVTEAKSDQWNADDLVGGEMIVTVKAMTLRPGTDQPVTVHLEEGTKVFRPCKTVARIMKAAWGPDSAKYAGRSMMLYHDPDVTWGGMKVGGIRVRAISDIDNPMVLALQEKKGSKKIITVRPLEKQVSLIDRARSAIESAADLDALKKVWANKAMAPFREELQSLLDERKAALTPAQETDGD